MSQIKIGKTTLNFIDCELSKEKSALDKELLAVVRDRNVIEYPGIIEEKAAADPNMGYKFLYHLSEMRGNIVRWMPIKSGDSVLELNAECGAITATLTKLSDNVTVYSKNATDAEILAERLSNCKNLFIYSGPYESVAAEIREKGDKYDWIIIRDADYLLDAATFLNPNGRIIFISDNRMGMRNLAGVKACGEKDYFTGVTGSGESGFTFTGMKKLAAIAGYKKVQMYYPYPDYRFTVNLYSDVHMPKVGELVLNEGALEADRYKLFSEKEAFDASCEDGSFPLYSNSYLMVLGTPLDTEFARFSNDRAPEYAIFTTIENLAGYKVVKKRPITDSANNHIRNLSDYYTKLKKRYAGSKLSVNRCNLIDLGDRVFAEFEYVEGTELSKLMDLALKKDDIEGFYKLFDKYVSLVGYNDEEKFGDFDAVFSNILVNGDKWTLIDYEWCKDSQILIRETAYRSIYCYLLEDSNRKKFNVDLLLKKIELSKEASEDIEQDEIIFQKKVTGRNLALSEIRERLGFNVIDLKEGAGLSKEEKAVYKFRIYPETSEGGFSEESAYDVADAYKAREKASVTINVEKNVKQVRIDPLDAPCIVSIRECKLSEYDFPIEKQKYLYSNGKRLGERTFVFDTADPNLYFNFDGFLKDEDTFLFVEMDITPLKEDTARVIVSNIKKFF